MLRNDTLWVNRSFHRVQETESQRSIFCIKRYDKNLPIKNNLTPCGDSIGTFFKSRSSLQGQLHYLHVVEHPYLQCEHRRRSTSCELRRQRERGCGESLGTVAPSTQLVAFLSSADGWNDRRRSSSKARRRGRHGCRTVSCVGKVQTNT
jgi:hypothetical protein